MAPEEYISMFKKSEEKSTWNFTNILAFTVVVACLGFLFTAPYAMSKFETKDNTMLSQIITGILGIVMVIVAFYFGSSVGSARQQQQITEMHKTATDIALNSSTKTSSTSEQKIDKGVKIGELQAALKDLDPESEEAKKILEQLKELEKQS